MATPAPPSLSRRSLLAGSLALMAPVAHPTGTGDAARFDRRILGWANDFKEGDAIAGLAAEIGRAHV